MNFFNNSNNTGPKKGMINIYPYPERAEKQLVTCDEWKTNPKFKEGDHLDFALDTRSDNDKKKGTYYSPVEYKNIKITKINKEKCAYNFEEGTAHYPTATLKNPSGEQPGPMVDKYGILHDNTQQESTPPMRQRRLGRGGGQSEAELAKIAGPRNQNAKEGANHENTKYYLLQIINQ
jgi:hypothetical protein